MFTNIYKYGIYDIYQIWYQSKTRVDMFEFSGPGASWSWITGKAQICMTARRRFFFGGEKRGWSRNQTGDSPRDLLEYFFLAKFGENRLVYLRVSAIQDIQDTKKWERIRLDQFAIFWIYGSIICHCFMKQLKNQLFGIPCQIVPWWTLLPNQRSRYLQRIKLKDVWRFPHDASKCDLRITQNLGVLFWSHTMSCHRLSEPLLGDSSPDWPFGRCGECRPARNRCGRHGWGYESWRVWVSIRMYSMFLSISIFDNAW